MVASQLFFSFVFLSFLHLAAGSLRICPAFCGGSGPIIFPFQLPHQSDRCGYPGFELSCNTSEIYIHLPNSLGNRFIVRNIDYITQSISINDPDHCLPRRLLDNSFSLLGSPFEHVGPVENFIFLNCSSDRVPNIDGLYNIYCLSGGNYSTVAIRASHYNKSWVSNWQSCSNISTVLVPILWLRWSNLEDEIPLRWSEPNCKSCEEQSGICGFMNFESEDLTIGCAEITTKTGLLQRVQYGIIVGLTMPALLCLIGVGCCLCGRVRAHYERHRLNNGLVSMVSITQPPIVSTGLAGITIESFPKTKLGDSGRLPNPNDNTCPICLSEYQPKETLRTIPECRHYFHANCIDEWLKLNATCPLCRNSPEGSKMEKQCASTSPNSNTPSSLSGP